MSHMCCPFGRRVGLSQTGTGRVTSLTFIVLVVADRQSPRSLLVGAQGRNIQQSPRSLLVGAQGRYIHKYPLPHHPSKLYMACVGVKNH